MEKDLYSYGLLEMEEKETTAIQMAIHQVSIPCLLALLMTEEKARTTWSHVHPHWLWCSQEGLPTYLPSVNFKQLKMLQLL